MVNYTLLWPVTFLCLVSIAASCLLEDDRSAVYASIFEDAPVGSIIATLPLANGTAGQASLAYKLHLLDGHGIALLEPTRKMLALRRPLDRDNNDTKFEIIIGCDSLADKSIPRVNISVHLTVRDVNDNAPAFAQSEFSIQVPEELPEGTPIRLDFTATDVDEPGPNSYIHYRILEDEMDPLIAGLIHIPDRHVPEIVVGGRIDFERLRAFDLELEAEDDGSPSLHTRARLHVEVVDQDDLNPRFDYDLYSSSEIMGSSLQVYPKPIHARDQDSFNEALFYELSGDNHQFYAINASGHVTMASNAFVATTLIVHARQVNRPEREATAILVISNHSTIHFQKDLYSIQLSAKSPKGMELVQVHATTSGHGRDVRYEIVDDYAASVLSVDEFSGRIFLSETPTVSNYSIKVSAFDGKSTAYTTVDLSFGDLNIYEPTFDQKEYSFEVTGAELIGQLRAQDRDPGDSISYRLLNFERAFKIDEEGMLSVRNSLELTSAAFYELVVMAEDAHGHRSFATVKLNARSTAVQFYLSAAAVVTCCVVIGVLSKLPCNSWTATCLEPGVILRDSSSKTIDGLVASEGTLRSSRYLWRNNDEKDFDVGAMSYVNSAASFSTNSASNLANRSTDHGPIARQPSGYF